MKPTSSLATLLKQLKDAYFTYSKKDESKSFFSFFNTKKKNSEETMEQKAIRYIFDTAQLSEAMQTDDLKKAIILLQNIKISIGPNQFISLNDYQGKGLNLFTQKEIEPYKEDFLPISIEEESIALPLLAKTLQFLEIWYVNNLHQSLRSQPVETISYEQKEINQLPLNEKLVSSTKAEQLRDKSNIFMDLLRKSVTIKSLIITPINTQDNQDEVVIRAIEELTGDKFDDPNSRARKLYQFGGQYLLAEILQEFTQQVKLEGRPQVTLERGASIGRIDWLNNENGEVYCHLELKILTCSFVPNIDDPNSPQTTAAIGSDGTSVVELNGDLQEKICQKASQIATGKIPNTLVPLCRIKATIFIEDDPQNEKQHFMSCRSYQCDLYTQDLIYNKPVLPTQPEAEDIQSPSPS